MCGCEWVCVMWIVMFCVMWCVMCGGCYIVILMLTKPSLMFKSYFNSVLLFSFSCVQYYLFKFSWTAIGVAARRSLVLQRVFSELFFRDVTCQQLFLWCSHSKSGARRRIKYKSDGFPLAVFNLWTRAKSQNELWVRKKERHEIKTKMKRCKTQKEWMETRVRFVTFHTLNDEFFARGFHALAARNWSRHSPMKACVKNGACEKECACHSLSWPPLTINCHRVLTRKSLIQPTLNFSTSTSGCFSATARRTYTKREQECVVKIMGTIWPRLEPLNIWPCQPSLPTAPPDSRPRGCRWPLQMKMNEA